MNLKHALFTLMVPLLSVLGLSAFGAPLLAQEEDAPPIVTHMREVGDNLRALRQSYSDASQRQENISRVESMLENIRAARELEPLKTPELPQSEREQFLSDYRAQIDATIDEMEKLRSAFEAGDSQAARDLLVRLNDLRKEGHGAFRKDD